jgi:hypothetical protein
MGTAQLATGAGVGARQRHERKNAVRASRVTRHDSRAAGTGAGTDASHVSRLYAKS